MKDEKLKLVVENILNTEEGILFIVHLIQESGCLSREVNFDTLKQYYFAGRKGLGLYILELVRKCNFKKFIEIQERRKD